MAAPYLEGFDVFTDLTMTESGEPYQERIPWSKRLFSLPWRPLKKTKTVVPQVPSKTAIRFQNRLIMHPEMLEVIKNHLSVERG